MPLTWDARECDTDLEDDWDNILTHSVVLLTMPIGMRAITESNWKEFYKRVYVWQQMNGQLLQHEGKKYNIEPLDIYRRIGLRTNSRVMTKTQFIRAMGNMLYMEANQGIWLLEQSRQTKTPEETKT